MTIFNNNSDQLRFYIITFAVIFSMLSSGCSMNNDWGGHGYKALPGSLHDSKAGHWISELEKVQKLTSDEYQQVLKAREVEYSNIGGLESRIRLSLLLLQGQEIFRDPPRGLEILQSTNAASGNQEAAFVAFLIQIAEQQTKLNTKKSIVRQGAKATGKYEAHSKRRQPVIASQEGQKNYLKEYKDAKARIQELEQQLLELTSIEQNIQERESGMLIKEKK